jgi:hypothetical protein
MSRPLAVLLLYQYCDIALVVYCALNESVS